MFDSLISICLAFVISEPPGGRPLPSIDEVRKALKQNVEGAPNRRIKFVVVGKSGEPMEKFPAIDSENREEYERTEAADGRWRDQYTMFRWSGVFESSDSAFDGNHTTKLEGHTGPVDSFTDKGLRVSIELRYATGIQRGNAKQNFQSRFSPFWENLHRRIGVRSTLSWESDRSSLLLLKPRVDDQSGLRETITLDPEKNYWPTAGHSEVTIKNGEWKTQTRIRVIEFQGSSGRLFPKRMTIWHPDARNTDSRNIETQYVTVVKAEFPLRFDDKDFAIVIPDGTPVNDFVSGRIHEDGRADTSWDDVAKEEAEKPPPYDLWLIYFCFFLLALVVAGAARHLLIRGRPQPPNKLKSSR